MPDTFRDMAGILMARLEKKPKRPTVNDKEGIKRYSENAINAPGVRLQAPRPCPFHRPNSSVHDVLAHGCVSAWRQGQLHRDHSVLVVGAKQYGARTST